MAVPDEVKLVADRFGARLVQLRGDAGISQMQLAKLCGVSQAAVSQYEKGTSLPGWDIVLALASALGVSAAAFQVAADKPAE